MAEMTCLAKSSILPVATTSGTASVATVVSPSTMAAMVVATMSAADATAAAVVPASVAVSAASAPSASQIERAILSIERAPRIKSRVVMVWLKGEMKRPALKLKTWTTN